MALKIADQKGIVHTFLWMGVGPMKALIKGAEQDTKIFCIEHGRYEPVATLEIATARSEEHTIEKWEKNESGAVLLNWKKGERKERCRCNNPKHQHGKLSEPKPQYRNRGRQAA